MPVLHNGRLIGECKKCVTLVAVKLVWEQEKDWHKWRLIATCKLCGHVLTRAKSLNVPNGLVPPMPDISLQRELF